MSEGFQSYRAIAAVRDSSLPATQRHVLIAVAFRADSSGECWASQATLADDTGLGERTVRRDLALLVQARVLVARTTPGRTTTYRVVIEAIPPRPEPAPNTPEPVPSDAIPSPAPVCRTPPTPAPPARVTAPTPAPHADPLAPHAGVPRHHMPPTPAPHADDPSRDPSIRSVQEPSKGDARPVALLLDAPEPKPDPAPAWATKARRPKGVTPAALADAVSLCVTAIRGTSGTAAASNAEPVVSLWGRLGHPPLAAFVADVEAVALAARECPEPMFARDIRAEGWTDGTDRSRVVASVCRFGPPARSQGATWDERVEAARRWDQAGRPKEATTPRNGARASPLARGEWVDTRTPEQRAAAAAEAERSFREDW